MKHALDRDEEINLPDGRVIVDLDERFAFFASLQNYLSNRYKEQRQAEYPAISDYLDGVVKGDRAQIDAYIAACQAVKAKYPKP